MEPDRDEFEQVEQDLAEVLKNQYGVTPHSLDLSPAEQASFDARNRRILDDILATPLTPGVPTPRGRSPLRLLAAAAALVLAVAGGTAIWLSADDSGTENRPTWLTTPPLLTFTGGPRDDARLDEAPADVALAELARTAGRQPELDRSKLVTLVETASWALPTSPRESVNPDVKRYYRKPDNSVLVLTRQGDPLTPAGKVGSDQTSGGYVEGSAGVDAINPDVLPEDPAELRRYLTAPAICADSQVRCLFDAIETLGRSYLLEPSLSAALARTLIGVDDVAYLGTTRDRTGRTSAVFSSTHGRSEEQRLLLIDVTTGRYSGDETVRLRADQRARIRTPAVTEFHAVIDRKEVPQTSIP